MEFFPSPHRAPLRAFAALVIPWQANKVLLCNIAGRGWSIPSGRVEPYEDPIETAVREAHEEAGATLTQVQYIGCYRITERGETRYADVFTGQVAELDEVPDDFRLESLGRELYSLGDLPGLYHNWNELFDAVFGHAKEIHERLRRLEGS